MRTRFAPSPTGYMHIGNLRSALYAYLYAKGNGGDFILRIEDTDQNRLVEGAVDIIYNTLKSVGLNWDEGPDVGGEFGPYVQSERKSMYLPLANELVKKGHAYPCFCTVEELGQRREKLKEQGETFKYDKHCMSLTDEQRQEKMRANIPYVIRQNIPQTGETSFRDLLFGDITVENSTLDDNVLIKADGMPTYNFANVVDDHLMGITHVMRGMEYLSSTPKYNLLYRAFGWDIPEYIHMPPIMKDAQHKLSKRTGDASFEDFVQQGYLVEAIVNYIALLGWSPGDDRELFTIEELIKAFDIKGMSKSPAIFDIKKLTWLNAEYIRNLSEQAFTEYASSYYERAGISHMDKSLLARILQKRVELFSQITDMVDFLSKLDEGYDLELYNNKKAKTDKSISLEILTEATEAIENLARWDEAALHDMLIDMAAQKNVKNGTMLWPIRIALAGKAVTPGGAIEIAMLLGKDESVRRLRLAINRLSR